ncbi:MAG: bifunctional hydroxymethylpyrimidine kinase/phosphomethylpyrimidine kinase [Sphaerochaetaceae bacterium]|jgi:pyridoxine kinase|nr:bifunctional hydroxymethylpyrimidine kinase/phosphomethylpyrimidine kinase [Sphaerochaetaceae bacterium]MDD3162673.1 bifunctional hydroxymethylpyrimidine kinase/phosphomethylpyrimidine kinase [Sphaerochaetaceae bacterium]MDD4006889.1 bifunctional hydroxymethylpyrimidine kinase/phosphomethylpyrimidine kinase [Sphaerochaetaceae bacterium]MDD4396804.1 bifunctional hydroxymethylpyrimidine kinase/phosphomethylpyrimidine kinase [Sphaerochaetaceae bacterium]
MKRPLADAIKKPPLCLAVHDICTYAKSSLTVVIPVMEELGVEVCPLPAAVLSSQIDGFDDYYQHDLLESTRRIASCLKAEQLKFDCLYSGFLSTPQLAYSVKNLKSLARTDALIAVDPVLGDYGKLYSSFDDEMIEAVSLLVQDADVIKPNWTEGCLLSKTPYEETPDDSTVENVLCKLHELAPQADIAMTGVCFSDKRRELCNIACLSHDDGQLWVYSHPKEPESLPGSGDFFCSVMVSSILHGDSFKSAVETAGKETRRCIELTSKAGFERRHGICTSLWMKSR